MYVRRLLLITSKVHSHTNKNHHAHTYTVTYHTILLNSQFINYVPTNVKRVISPYGRQNKTIMWFKMIIGHI